MAKHSTRLLLLIVFLWTIVSSSSSAQQQRIWNIDCGAERGFRTTTNSTWLGDGDYVRAGERHRLQNATALGTLATLRAFPKNRKNCYVVPVGKGRKVLVTARFHYGNYDGRSLPPRFRLMFDGNEWSPVSTSAEKVRTYVAVYVTTREEASVCLGKVKGGRTPFISSLSLTLLEEGMYGLVNSSHALYKVRSAVFGLNHSITGYPEDPFNRIWTVSSKELEGFTYRNLPSNSNTSLNTNGSANHPPAKMFTAAATPRNGEENLTILSTYLPPRPQAVYFSMYFAEMLNLSGTNKRRSFHIYFNEELLSDPNNPITPQFGSVLEFSTASKLANNSTRFSLAPTANSTLPPIISGWEVSWISGVLNNGTRSTDVDALMVLQDEFRMLREWTGDPCLPRGYVWEWVNCSLEDPPRITELLLGGYGLAGNLPNFKDLTALENIDFHNNNLSGTIPEFLGRLPNLRTLNLAYNDFSEIPSTLKNNSKISLNVTGNRKLDLHPASPPVMPPAATGGTTATAPHYLIFILPILIAVLTWSSGV